MADTRALYEEDFVAWAEQQAAALRAAARSGSNLELDWQNLAEEVESLGASERRTLHSQIQRVIRHLLKLEFSPAPDPRRGWFETVGGARDEIELVLEMNPSLRNELDSVAQAELARGARAAIRDLQKDGEIDADGIARIQAARYTTDQIVGEWFPPDPQGAE
jgi:hypothetical protein